MDLQLFKTGLKMFLRPLVMILWSNKGLRKWAKKQGGATKKKTSQLAILSTFWRGFTATRPYTKGTHLQVPFLCCHEADD